MSGLTVAGRRSERRIEVGYLTYPTRRETDEERAGWEVLRGRRDIRAFKIRAGSASSPPLLWWHSDSLTPPPPEFIGTLARHLKQGGSLLLTLLAARSVVELGLEERPPDTAGMHRWNEGCWAPGYPDIRGLGGYRGHPVFSGLGGGVFTWTADGRIAHGAAWYSGDAPPPRGRILAVERQYIRLDENRLCALEYRTDRGGVITLGAHVYFAVPHNRFRPHLEHLVINCFRYLHPSERRRVDPDIRPTWWPAGGPACHVDRNPPHVPRIRRGSPGTWKHTSGLLLRREEASKNSFNVGGRRLLLCGDERRGVTEVWAHPVRILRDLRWKVILQGRTVVDSRRGRPEILASPEMVTRHFRASICDVAETSAAALRDPAGVVRLDMRSDARATIVVSGTIDLRLMWPLSDRATGNLGAWWDKGRSAVVVVNEDGNAAGLFGISVTPEAVDLKARSYNPRRRSAPPNAHLAFTMRIPAKRGRRTLLMAAAGSGLGLREAVSAYRRVLQRPATVPVLQAKRTGMLLKRARAATAGNPSLADAYLRAVVSLDRFLVETPGVGCSLQAGFGDTRRGWSGGHQVSGRPGYAWYFGRDGVWSSLALLACGETAQVRCVLEFLGDHQDITGKIPHEVTTSGHAHYDAADSTPLYVLLMGRYLRATGDAGFVHREYLRIRRAVEHCAGTDRDGDGLIENTGEGHGWIEGGKLFPAHAELYLNACWAAALEEAACLAAELGRRDDRRRWDSMATATWRTIWRQFPHPHTGFPAFAKRRNGTFRRDETALAAVALLFGRPPRRVTEAVLRRLAHPSFSTPWGFRMVPKGSRAYNPAGYHTGSIWPLFTGWTALAAAAQGKHALARRFLEMNAGLFRRFSLGHVPEVLHGEECTSAGVCDHQAWSEAMIVLPFAAIATDRPTARGSETARAGRVRRTGRSL